MPDYAELISPGGRKVIRVLDTDSSTTSNNMPGIWGAWNAILAPTSSVTYNNNVLTWNSWNNSYSLSPKITSSDVAVSSYIQRPGLSVPTPQQAANWARHDREYSASLVNFTADKSEAEMRAKVLLESVLDSDQVEELRARDRFFVRSRSGKRYLIQRGVAGNVFHVREDSDDKLTRYCIHPQHEGSDIPIYDVMLAQKLLLESDEATFLHKANASQAVGYGR